MTSKPNLNPEPTQLGNVSESGRMKTRLDCGWSMEGWHRRTLDPTRQVYSELERYYGRVTKGCVSIAWLV